MEGRTGEDPSRPEAVAAADANGADWRAHLQPDARQRIVRKIEETLKRDPPKSVPEGLNGLQKFAVRLEEKIYTASTSQADYLKNISLKMLSWTSQSTQGPAGNTTVPNISHAYQSNITQIMELNLKSEDEEDEGQASGTGPGN